MTKQIPLVSGHYYHIYNRGNNGANLFIEERNYHYFFKLYSHYIYPLVNTYAYCLMRNHFHLLVRMNPIDLPGFKNLEGLEPPNYSQAFSNLFNSYTKAINKAYNRSGSLFEKNFKRIPIESDDYFIHLVSYIHRNPQKHGFVEDFRTYPYSSYQTIAAQKNSRLEQQQVLQWFGNLQTFKHYHQSFDDTQITDLIKDAD